MALVVATLVFTVPEALTLTHWIADQSAHYIRERRDPTKPFFLWASFHVNTCFEFKGNSAKGYTASGDFAAVTAQVTAAETSEVPGAVPAEAADEPEAPHA